MPTISQDLPDPIPETSEEEDRAPAPAPAPAQAPAARLVRPRPTTTPTVPCFAFILADGVEEGRAGAVVRLSAARFSELLAQGQAREASDQEKGIAGVS